MSRVLLKTPPSRILCPKCGRIIVKRPCPPALAPKPRGGAAYACEACVVGVVTMPGWWSYSDQGSCWRMVLFTPFLPDADPPESEPERVEPRRPPAKSQDCRRCGGRAGRVPSQGGGLEYACTPCGLVSDSYGSVLRFATLDDLDAISRRKGTVR